MLGQVAEWIGDLEVEETATPTGTLPRRLGLPLSAQATTTGSSKALRGILRCGFMQNWRSGEGLKLACSQAKLPGIDLDDITYYIGRETIIPREDIPGMWVWRETCLRFCNAMPSVPLRSLGFPLARSSSSAPRSRGEPAYIAQRERCSARIG